MKNLMLLVGLAASVVTADAPAQKKRTSGPFTKIQKGDRLLAQGQPRIALRVYRSVLRDKPEFAPLHFKIALCLQIDKKDTEALVAVKRALKFDEELLPALLLAAELTAKSQPATAVAYLEKAVVHPEADLQVFKSAVRSLTEADAFEKAFEVFDDAIEKVEPDADLMYAGAELALEAAKLERARKCYEWITKDNPKDPTALESLGRVAKLMGDDDAALEAYRKTLAVKPSNQDVRREVIAMLADNPEAAQEIAKHEKLLRYYDAVQKKTKAGKATPPAPGGKE